MLRTGYGPLPGEIELRKPSSPGIAHGGHRGIGALGDGCKSLGEAFDPVPMTHPDDPALVFIPFVEPGEKILKIQKIEFHPAVFPFAGAAHPAF